MAALGLDLGLELGLDQPPGGGLEAVGQLAECGGEAVARSAGAGLLAVADLGPDLGGPHLLGDSVACDLLVFGDHELAPSVVPVLDELFQAVLRPGPAAERVAGGTFWRGAGVRP
jgi:hypothetical protein